MLITNIFLDEGFGFVAAETLQTLPNSKLRRIQAARRHCVAHPELAEQSPGRICVRKAVGGSWIRYREERLK